MGFSGYFLIVWDFINWAKEHGIPVGPGRGSGAGSLVAYALRITDLDPIPYNLLFERFLNPERVSMPDFDVDFCMDRRDEVIKYVAREVRQGPASGRSSTFHSSRRAACIRDVGARDGDAVRRGRQARQARARAGAGQVARRSTRRSSTSPKLQAALRRRARVHTRAARHRDARSRA